jgi:hypothetical protein
LARNEKSIFLAGSPCSESVRAMRRVTLVAKKTFLKSQWSEKLFV